MKKERSIPLLIIQCLGGLFLFAALVIALLPAFFSTSWGKKNFVQWVQNQTGFHVEIAEISLSWFGSQSLQGIRANDPQKGLSFSCTALTSDASLLRLLKKNVGHLKLQEPYLLATNSSFSSSKNLSSLGIKNFPKAGFCPLFTLETSFSNKGSLSLKGQVLIEEGKIDLRFSDLEPVRFSKIYFSFSRLEKDQIDLAFQGNANQQGIEGTISLKGTATELESLFPRFAMQAAIHQFPLVGIDQLASLFYPQWNGLIVSCLGNKIDLQCSVIASERKVDLHLDASSSQVSAHIATKTENNLLSLKNPAEIRWNLTPAFFLGFTNFIPGLNELRLNEPALLDATLTDFSCKVPSKIEDLLHSAFHLDLNCTALNLALNGVPLSFEGFSLKSATSLLEQEISLSLSSDLKTGPSNGKLLAEGNIISPFTPVPRGSVTFNITQLPVDLLSVIKPAFSSFSSWLGSTAAIQGTLELGAKPQLHLFWESELLTLPALHLSLSKPFTLMTPSKFLLKANPALLPPWLKIEPLEGNLEKLVVPAEMKNSSVEATLSIPFLSFSGEYPLSLEKPIASFKMNTFDQIAFLFKSHPLEFSLEGAFKPNSSEFIFNRPLFIQYALSGLQQWFPNFPSFSHPSVIQITVDPFAFPFSLYRNNLKNRDCGKEAPQNYNSERATMAQGPDANENHNFEVKPTQPNPDSSDCFSINAWTKKNIKATLSSSEISLEAGDQKIEVQNLSFPLYWNAKSKELSAQFSATTKSSAGSAGSMQGRLNLSHFLQENAFHWNSAVFGADLSLQNIPSRFLDIFSKEISISTLIGPTFSNKIKLESTFEEQNIVLKWNSSLLNLDSHFLINEKGLQLQGNNSQISWTLTPESYRLIDQLLFPNALGKAASYCGQIYRNNLKNRDCGKEAPQNCDSEQATMAQGPGASENRNFEEPPCHSPDSSDCFGIDSLESPFIGESEQIELIKKKKRKNNSSKTPLPPKKSIKPYFNPFELSEPSLFAITLSKLFLPIASKLDSISPKSRIPNFSFDFDKTQFSFSGRNGKLSFSDKTSSEGIQLSAISFSLNKTEGQNPLLASLQSSILTHSSGTKSTTEAIKNGSFALEMKLLTPINPEKNFNFSELAGSFQAKAQQFPSRILDILARTKGNADLPFSTSFGPMINAVITADLKKFSGPFAINLHSSQARLDLEGNFTNGTAFLKNTLHAQIRITPELSRLILKEINPLNLSSFYSQGPITLEIPSSGFSLPLYPLNLAEMSIPQAKIELGKIACRNEGNINIALGLLKSSDQGRELSLWFAPIDLHVKKGIVDVERTEILLANAFDICTWGNVDLVKDYVDMKLGLTAQTLSKAFGIKNLPENYVLTIPMKGPSSNVQINTSKATAKVALLLAWQNQNIAGAIGGPTGALVGELLGKIATLPDSDAKVPPAKHPFPWETSRAKKTSQGNREKKKQFKPTDKPLKQILKIIR